MKTQLAWLNLLHQKTRSAVAVAGVSFAVVLVLLQLGFLASVRQTATRIYDHLDFDLLLTSPEYLHLAKAGTIERVRLAQAASLPEVAGASALDVGFQLWRNVATGQRRGIMLMALDPHDHVFALAEVLDQQEPAGKIRRGAVGSLEPLGVRPARRGRIERSRSASGRGRGRFHAGNGLWRRWGAAGQSIDVSPAAPLSPAERSQPGPGAAEARRASRCGRQFVACAAAPGCAGLYARRTEAHTSAGIG